uniref:Uncharacterized protein n=1 Tax=Lotus japonicus TaxID=34305 RepID=I3SWN1_LOTJA|nr:unknown [Lotus japonicus]
MGQLRPAKKVLCPRVLEGQLRKHHIPGFFRLCWFPLRFQETPGALLEHVRHQLLDYT